jgi:plastocyanin
MRAPALVLIAAAAAVPGAAAAADLAVQVRDARGAAVPNAVVAVHLIGRPTPLPKPARAYRVEQRNIQFDPFVLVVPVGADVAFPNLDAVRHHVYSFSPPKRFELKLYAKDQSRSIRFDKAGIVPLGCNIHDQMSAFIDVVDTVWTAKTDAAGAAVIRDIPPGRIAIDLWHPYLRAPGNRIARPIALAASGAREAFAVELRKPPRPAASHY